MRSSTDSLLSFLKEASFEEAPTPIISNCFPTQTPKAIKLPPAMHNNKGKERKEERHEKTNGSAAYHSQLATTQVPRFSSMKAEPIIMTRPLKSEDLVSARTSESRFIVPRTQRRPRDDNKMPDVSSPSTLPLPNDRKMVGTVASVGVMAIDALMRRMVYSLKKGLIQQQQKICSVHMLPSIPTSGGPNESAVDRGDGRIHGIRNYGNSCFLNSVLQALASLEPFVAYLHRIVELDQERKESLCWEASLDTISDTSSSLSENLLSVLLLVNGAEKSDNIDPRGVLHNIDPRGVLHAVGKKHTQFKAKHGGDNAHVGKEQQDAEELLQALIGIIVEDAHLDSISSAAPSSFRDPATAEYNDDDLLTVVSGIREKLLHGTSTLLGSSIDAAPSESLALSHLTLESSTAACSKVPLKEENGFHAEEKKDSGPLLESFGSDVSVAMEIMRSTISSITPSPLCGWMGSALQCRGCKHVRPIQNAPFYDIPVVPTAVSKLLAASSRRSPGDPPRKYTPTNENPPCTLEECLEEFTSVERVQDVECRCCTLKAEIANLEDEVGMLTEVVQGLVARAKRNGSDIKDENEHGSTLREELRIAESRLTALQKISPDDEEEMDELFASQDDQLPIDDTTKIKMKREDAFKCLLLTRLPSTLCIHVQRRYYDPSSNRMSKTMQHVIFPECLNIAPYCAYGGNLSPDTRWAGTPSRRRGDGSPGPIHYKLMSVIEHRGGAFYGHYVCYRREPLSGRWFYISDDVVRTVDWHDVRHCQAYMLFYEAM